MQLMTEKRQKMVVGVVIKRRAKRMAKEKGKTPRRRGELFRGFALFITSQCCSRMLLKNSKKHEVIQTFSVYDPTVLFDRGRFIYLIFLWKVYQTLNFPSPTISFFQFFPSLSPQNFIIRLCFLMKFIVFWWIFCKDCNMVDPSTSWGGAAPPRPPLCEA